DREGINLFKIEDNIDFGTRILKDYARQFGLWEGVKRYKGWIADDPESEHSAEEYLAKVQRIYAFRQPTPSTPELLQSKPFCHRSRRRLYPAPTKRRPT